MSPDWLRFDLPLADDPRTWELAEALDVDRAQALGHVLLLFIFATNYAADSDGDLSGFTATAIARGAGWQGDSARFVAALKNFGWTVATNDGRLELPDWWNTQGKLIKERRLDAERKRAERLKVGGHDPGPTLTGRPPDIPRTSEGRPPLRTDGTDETDATHETNPPPPSPAAGLDGREGLHDSHLPVTFSDPGDSPAAEPEWSGWAQDEHNSDTKLSPEDAPADPTSGAQDVQSTRSDSVDGDGQRRATDQQGISRGSPAEAALEKLAALIDLWNTAAAAAGLPLVEADTVLHPKAPAGKSRKRTALERLKEHPDLGEWGMVIGRIAARSFCRGENNSGWRADLAYLTRVDTFDDHLTGRYSAPPRGRRPTQAVETGVDYDRPAKARREVADA